MKLVLVLCACIAGSLAGFVPAGNYGYGYPVVAAAPAQVVAAPAGVLGVGKVAAAGATRADALKAADQLRDSRRGNAASQLWSNAQQAAGRRSQGYGDEANREAERSQEANSDFGQNAGSWDKSADAASRAAARDSAWSQGENQWARKDAADRAAANNLWAEGNQFRQGRRNSDNIDYGFDKKFNTRSHEDGGYDYNESSDSHALDDYADRSNLYDRKRSDHAAQAAKANAQSADRKAAWGQKAAAAAASADKFGRDYDSNAWANGANKDLAQKLDASQAGNRYWADARDRALDAYSDLAARDSNAARQSAALGAADGAKLGLAAGDYGYGVAGVKGYAPKPGALPLAGLHGKGLAAADYAKRAGAADLARLWDQSQKNTLKQAAKDSSKDEGKQSFSKDQWLNDRVQGFNRDQAAKANDHGYSNWANNADQSSAGHDAKAANAASKSAASQGRWDLDENVWASDNRKRNLSDRKANKRVSKKFFSNKDNGGDNWERLNYDRDQVDDVFGFKAGVKKDAANRAQASRFNSAFDANARKADAARAADAARSANSNDWRKEAAGWQNADAAWSEAASGDQRGLRNDKYKTDVGQESSDAAQRRGSAFDRAAARFGANSNGQGQQLAGRVGYGVAAAPAAYGYAPAAYGAYPVKGGFGYGY